MLKPQCAAIGTNPPAVQASITVSEFPLNRHQSFRAEVIERDGKHVVAISRWKITPAGVRRTGQSLEFGAHRAHAVASLLDEVLRMLNVLENKGQPSDGRAAC
jgi:hypothetical protein